MVAAVGWISTAAIARLLDRFDARGNPRARAGRDWCARHSIPVRRDGKFNFARLVDVQRALEGLPPANDTRPERRDRVAALVARTVAGEGRRHG